MARCTQKCDNESSLEICIQLNRKSHMCGCTQKCKHCKRIWFKIFDIAYQCNDTYSFWSPYYLYKQFISSIYLIVIQGHRQSTSCTVLFMALYFCCMAAFAWWACLALAWFLAAGLKWGHEAIENKSHLFHLVAWAIPALQTICVLAMGKVEGE